jgi:hypothetical protein
MTSSRPAVVDHAAREVVKGDMIAAKLCFRHLIAHSASKAVMQRCGQNTTSRILTGDTPSNHHQEHHENHAPCPEKWQPKLAMTDSSQLCP